MVKYKLLYINAKGRAELIRFIFASCEVEFEDDRIPIDEWKTVKKGKRLVLKIKFLTKLKFLLQNEKFMFR